MWVTFLDGKTKVFGALFPENKRPPCFVASTSFGNYEIHAEELQDRCPFLHGISLHDNSVEIFALILLRSHLTVRCLMSIGQNSSRIVANETTPFDNCQNAILQKNVNTPCLEWENCAIQLVDSSSPDLKTALKTSLTFFHRMPCPRNMSAEHWAIGNIQGSRSN